MTPEWIISQTKNWLQTLVIDLNLCPFARVVFFQGGIRYCVNNDHDNEAQLHALIDECVYLDNTPDIATSLFICPDGLNDFDGFLYFLMLAEDLLAAQGYEGIYQLASFHPDYCFAKLSPNDASNYTNRSPYPMLHLLREDSIEKALQSFTHPDRIPERNISLTRRLGRAKLQALLTTCLQPKP